MNHSCSPKMLINVIFSAASFLLTGLSTTKTMAYIGTLNGAVNSLHAFRSVQIFN